MKLNLLVVLVFISSGSINAQILISGVVDGDLIGKFPKAHEFYINEKISDLSFYGFGSKNNSQFQLAINNPSKSEYYAKISQNVTGGKLRFELYNLIKDHIEFEYTSSRIDLWDILMKSDENPNNPDNVILLYTGRSQSKLLNSGVDNGDPDNWNREHVWSQSRGNFGTNPGIGTDAHNLKPADASVNSSRSNKDFDDYDINDGGSQHHEATDCYFDIDSWEPRDAVKGDVARMMFYMDVRYEGEGTEPELHIVDYTGALPDDKPPIIGKLSTLLQWHIDDPVDGFEQNRNDVIYSYQANRNPFIDHPEWVDEIWGSNTLNGPTILSSARNVTVPNADQDLVITTKVTDDTGVSKVVIIYQKNEAPQQSLSMSSLGGDNYTVTIPESNYDDADLLKYYIVAEDKDGKFDFGFITEMFTGITPISKVKLVGKDGRLVNKGIYAKVSGVAAVASGTFSTTSLNVYVQDANDGINIFKSKELTNIKRGNKYTISGMIDQYNGKTEIIPDDISSDIINNGPGILPSPIILTIDQLLADPEKYENKLVGIQHLSKTPNGEAWPKSEVTNYPNPEITVSDNNGVSIISLLIDMDTDIDGSAEPSWPKDVTGIFVQNDHYPYNGNYYIQPRDLNDIKSDGALPVELTTFSVNVFNNFVNLDWETATEVNNYGFEIERQHKVTSFKTYEWQNIGFVKGNGNSNSPKYYSFIDNSIKATGKYRYRLKQIDIDGKYEFTKEIEIEVAIPTKFEVAQNYPNPFNPTTTISFSIPYKQFVTVQIYNMLGEIVQTLVDEELNPGNYKYELDVTNLSSGNYFYQVVSGKNVEIRKMMLMK